MVTVDQAIIARYEKDGKHFEVLVDPQLAYELKEGRPVSLQRMLAVNQVLSDSKKGVRASPGDLELAFGTQDAEKIAEIIVKKGDIQLTTEFRRKRAEERTKQVADIISRHAINPQTKLPHPQSRVLAAMEQARVHVDPFKPAEAQVEDVIKQIKEIIPISIQEITLLVHVPVQHASRIHGMLKEFSIQQEKWLADGSLAAKIAVPAGLKEEIFRKIGNASQGTAQIEEEKK